MVKIEDLLKEREAQHGSFRDNATFMFAAFEIFRDIADKNVNENSLNKNGNPNEMFILSYVAAMMILAKLGRVASGGFCNPDNWIDIAGYAKIVYDHAVRNNQAMLGANDSNIKQ